jgi:hypothetical protein
LSSLSGVAELYLLGHPSPMILLKDFKTNDLGSVFRFGLLQSIDSKGT